VGCQLRTLSLSGVPPRCRRKRANENAKGEGLIPTISHVVNGANCQTQLLDEESRVEPPRCRRKRATENVRGEGGGGEAGGRYSTCSKKMSTRAYIRYMIYFSVYYLISLHDILFLCIISYAKTGGMDEREYPPPVGESARRRMRGRLRGLSPRLRATKKAPTDRGLCLTVVQDPAACIERYLAHKKAPPLPGPP